MLRIEVDRMWKNHRENGIKRTRIEGQERSSMINEDMWKKIEKEREKESKRERD